MSCEKITSGCYDKEGNESSPFFLLNHKHTVLASHLSPQCLDAFHTAEEPTMLDVERFFFLLALVCTEAEKLRQLRPHHLWALGRQLSALGT